jgi:hypothetical protein
MILVCLVVLVGLLDQDCHIQKSQELLGDQEALEVQMGMKEDELYMESIELQQC